MRRKKDTIPVVTLKQDAQRRRGRPLKNGSTALDVQVALRLTSTEAEKLDRAVEHLQLPDRTAFLRDCFHKRLERLKLSGAPV